MAERTYRVGVFREVRPGRVDRWAAYTRYYSAEWTDFYAELEVTAPSGTEAKKKAIEQCKAKVTEISSTSKAPDNARDSKDDG